MMLASTHTTEPFHISPGKADLAAAILLLALAFIDLEHILSTAGYIIAPNIGGFVPAPTPNTGHYAIMIGALIARFVLQFAYFRSGNKLLNRSARHRSKTLIWVAIHLFVSFVLMSLMVPTRFYLGHEWMYLFLLAEAATHLAIIGLLIVAIRRDQRLRDQLRVM